MQPGKHRTDRSHNAHQSKTRRTCRNNRMIADKDQELAGSKFWLSLVIAGKLFVYPQNNEVEVTKGET